jgi:hypothetical protein
MLKISQYPKNTDGSPMNLEVGVLVDDTGNGGARLQAVPVGPDGAPIDAVGMVLVDPSGALVPVSALNMVGAATRVSLANITIASLSAGASRYLVETGRKGVFVWNPANLAALVAADPLQGVLVAPTNDPTGNSGAWVRHVEGFHNVKWWGAIGDDVTDDGPAFAAALVYLKALRVSGAATYNEGTATLFVPRSKYFLNVTTLDITVGLRIFGESLGELGGEGTQLRWAANTPGIRIQTGLSVGDTGAYAGNANLNGGDASIIEKLALIGPGGASAEYNAILMRARATIRDCYIANWQGDAIKIKAVAGGGAGTEGNANNWEVSRCGLINCRNGLFVDGADTNAGKAELIDAMGNRQWGIWDSSFLGNTYIACHTATNTLGPYKTDDISARNLFLNCYSESDQPTSVFVGPTLVIGGLHAAGVSGVSWLTGEQGLGAVGNFTVSGNLFVLGSQNEIGPQTGTASDNIFYLSNTNSNTVVNFRSYAAGVPQIDASLVGYRNFGLYLNARLGFNFQYNGVDTFKITSTGADIQTGKVLSYAGTNLLVSGVLTAAAFPAISGDVTRPAGSLVSTIAANIVTYAKFQQVAANSLVGNPTGSLANAQGITLAGGLTFSGTTITIGGAITAATSIAIAGTITSSGGGMGYATGAGGTVAQATSKATGATLNKLCGQVTMNAAALAANTVVSFTLTNSQIAANDELRVWVAGGEATAGSYLVTQSGNASGSRVVCVRNLTAGSLSEAVVIGFLVNKAAIA